MKDEHLELSMVKKAELFDFTKGIRNKEETFTFLSTEENLTTAVRRYHRRIDIQFS
jgi:hypothetical protein